MWGACFRSIYTIIVFLLEIQTTKSYTITQTQKHILNAKHTDKPRFAYIPWNVVCY